MNLDGFFLHHDLLHYAVETSLDYKTAFYGMISNGVSIADFELPKEKRKMVFTDEAVYAEHIVNLVMVEAGYGSFDDFNVQLHQSLRQNNELLSPISLTPDQLIAIHSSYDILLQQWQALKTGEAMKLYF
jgi:hypothetical protein